MSEAKSFASRFSSSEKPLHVLNMNDFTEEHIDDCIKEHMEYGNELAKSYTPSVDEECTPSIGLEFESEESAYEFYNYYGRLAGFSIRKDYITRSRKDKVVLNRKFVCNKHGKRKPDKRNVQVKELRREKRTECGAHIYISLNRATEKWIVTKFTAEHNHLLHVRMCAQFMSSQRNLPVAHALNVGLAVDTNISLKASHDLMSTQVEGQEHLGFTREDLKCYLHSRRQRDLTNGDAGGLLEYLQEKSAKNPFFYHKFQLDLGQLITNIFWADYEMIKDYGNFGDVVLFDTTFQTNKEYHPFTCFVGYNHFRETVVFGAALLYDETTASFTWLFETFLDAMLGKRPITIFTDQDEAMAKAIVQVMPDVYHGLCTWRLRENATKHLGYLFGRGCKFANDLCECFYGYEEEHELVEAWQKLLDQYGLQENPWINKTWELRSKWAYVYMKWTFTAGIGSTPLNESLNGRLRKHLKSDHNILEFFTHFDRALEDLQFNELKYVFDAREKLPKLKVKKSPMLLKASRIYTNNIFELFQDEFENSLMCQVNQCDELDGQITYLVGEYGKDKRYRVWGNAVQQIVHCSCRKFEYIGILCSHAIRVLDRMGVMELPDKYILPRWRLDAKDGWLQGNIVSVNEEDPKLVVSTRYMNLCPKVVGLVASASKHKGAFQYLSNLVDEACKQVKSIKISKESGVGGDGENMYLIEGETEREEVDPSHARVKGLQKKDDECKDESRLKPWHEKIVKRNKKVSQPCSTSEDTHQSHDTINIQCSYQQESQGDRIPHGLQ